jgi:hypothetical protein
MINMALLSMLGDAAAPKWMASVSGRAVSKTARHSPAPEAYLSLLLMNDIGIRHAAKIMIIYYGNGAELAASRRADKAIAQSDPDSARFWTRIALTLSDLTSKKPNINGAWN